MLLKPVVNNGKNDQPQLVSWISAINSTVGSLSKFLSFELEGFPIKIGFFWMGSLMFSLNFLLLHLRFYQMSLFCFSVRLVNLDTLRISDFSDADTKSLLGTTDIEPGFVKGWGSYPTSVEDTNHGNLGGPPQCHPPQETRPY